MTRARKFLRASSGKQQEFSQVPDAVKYIKAQGYTDDGQDYIAHGKSAYRGKHLPLLLKAIEDMSHDEYDVLVLWDSSRFTRMGVESIFTLMAKAREAGGRIEFSASHAQGLNVASEWSPVMLAVQATADHLESERKKSHTIRDIAKHQAEGSIHGKPAWGWEIHGTRDNKTFVPSTVGRRRLPEIYQLAIKGWGCYQIARYVSDATGLKINEGTMNQIIRNPMNHGQRRNGGNLVCEELIPYAVWQEAIAAIESRRPVGRESKKYAPVLLKPYCAVCWRQIREGCNNGKSVMYVNRYSHGPYFRCSGAGPLRKGCGAPLVPQAELEAVVMEHYSKHPQKHYDRRWIPGTSNTEAIKKLNREIAEAAAKGDYGTVGRLGHQAQELSGTGDTRGRWETKDSGMTKGKYFSGLDPEAQRRFIAEDILVVEYRDHKVVVTEWIEGDEGGWTVAPWPQGTVNGHM